MMNKVSHVVLVAILAVAATVPAGLHGASNPSNLASTYSSPAGISYDLLGPTEGQGQTAGPADGADDSEPAKGDEQADRATEKAAPNESAATAGGPAAAESKSDYLIYFTATWCGPCRGYKPTVQKIRDEGLIKVHEVDIDNNPGAAAQWGVTSVPTTVIVKNGKIKVRYKTPVPYSQLKGDISP